MNVSENARRHLRSISASRLTIKFCIVVFLLSQINMSILFVGMTYSGLKGSKIILFMLLDLSVLIAIS